MRVLWREPEPTFHGTYANFDRAKSNPKPAQPDGVPILVGGHSAAAARRAGRLGDGYFPIGLRGDDFSERVPVAAYAISPDTRNVRTSPGLGDCSEDGNDSDGTDEQATRRRHARNAARPIYRIVRNSPKISHRSSEPALYPPPKAPAYKNVRDRSQRGPR